MKYPKKDLAQIVIASCIANGIDTVVISPGSRNAPLTIGFTSHPKIATYSIVDERAAGFVALGMAQQTQKPVALLCTSGSALLNYYPAIAEAFYSDIPLVVLSADRPEHLLEIGDGQTIQQKNVFENHIAYSANLITGENHHNAEEIKNALYTAVLNSAPVHINIPFDEPLYETVETILELPIEAHYDFSKSTLKEEPLDVDELQVYADKWNTAKKKIVLIGSSFPDELLETQIEHLLKDSSVLVFTETTSNMRHERCVNSIDQLLFPLTEEAQEELKPEILLTLGGLVVSKRIKQFFRKHQPVEHWHVNEHRALDSFHCMTRHFEISAQLFFSQFFFLTKSMKSDFSTTWLAVKKIRKEKHIKFLENTGYSDFKVHNIILESIPENSQLQLSNSSIVRYSQLFQLSPSIKVFCNRGTSGIDGSTSTAIGAAMSVEEQVVFLTGDISFFYDSNALWNAYIPSSFRVILINNNGGGIFKFIPGPQKSGALDYFETPHGLKAEHLCKMYGVSYQSVFDEKELRNTLVDFYAVSEQPKLLEIHTPSEINDVVLKEYFNNLK
ncbi:2-succinyl-5-enolpyruvyl-6-hydroxy-3-cyclohexene-1-carboxylic-acid synthase [Flavicella marina]|uniref:2-succinyl-5-enolpyruvyl-6-hydroxy-3- cyclohexene-1-carboxylic-acid synthase n=1 Tax=Flavicella marina TaxID=1475951 RepID=UPI001264AA41|nr:2-succinyl-5-enolpyruvyl-6-hydroxy-3-cyclohexene-1-carboxylic-acid synthase [Flavicella marina]